MVCRLIDKISSYRTLNVLSHVLNYGGAAEQAAAVATLASIVANVTGLRA